MCKRKCSTITGTVFMFKKVEYAVNRKKIIIQIHVINFTVDSINKFILRN